ncbi:MAG: hypothetical protein V2I33_24685 [Kangiellaceae bacterium]|jgi:hypothetical protein|nr:hypothetical protein [Kangiellaceae bacterium]
MERSDDALEICERALPLVRYSVKLHCKVLMRKAAAQKTSDVNSALSTIEEALRIEPGNRQAKALYNEIFLLKNEDIFREKKGACDSDLGERRIDSAVSGYRALLKEKLTRNAEMVAAVRANLCVCYLIKQ